jgi:hypothetical protein
VTEDFDISGFEGSERVQHRGVTCRGDAAEFRPIVERTIAFVKLYSETVGSGDLVAAYALTDSSLRQRMRFERFEEEHREGERMYRGPALEYQIERFVYVLADDAARQDKSDKGWDKRVPRERRRSRVLGFWIRNREKNTGCRGRLWITEEDGEYRVADFNFYWD